MTTQLLMAPDERPDGAARPGAHDPDPDPDPTPPKRLRGFAAIKAQDPERLREIARAGGHASRGSERIGHRWTVDEARAAGRKSAEARARRAAERRRDS